MKLVFTSQFDTSPSNIFLVVDTLLAPTNQITFIHSWNVEYNYATKLVHFISSDLRVHLSFKGLTVTHNYMAEFNIRTHYFVIFQLLESGFFDPNCVNEF